MLNLAIRIYQMKEFFLHSIAIVAVFDGSYQYELLKTHESIMQLSTMTIWRLHLPLQFSTLMELENI